MDNQTVCIDEKVNVKEIIHSLKSKEYKWQFYNEEIDSFLMATGTGAHLEFYISHDGFDEFTKADDEEFSEFKSVKKLLNSNKVTCVTIFISSSATKEGVFDKLLDCLKADFKLHLLEKA